MRHELAYFVTENLYLDHGDDPYNANVKNSNSLILSLLIDEATYKAWFTRSHFKTRSGGLAGCWRA